MDTKQTGAIAIPDRFQSRACSKMSPFVLDRVWKNFAKYVKDEGLCVVKITKCPGQENLLHISLETLPHFKTVCFNTCTWQNATDTVRVVLIQMDDGVYMFEYNELIGLTGEDPLAS